MFSSTGVPVEDPSAAACDFIVYHVLQCSQSTVLSLLISHHQEGPATLTVNFPGGDLAVGVLVVGDAVEDVEEGLREPEEVAEGVEAEVDEVAGELDDLEGQLVLLGVGEGPHVLHDVLEVRLHEVDGRLELAPHLGLCLIRDLVVVVAGKKGVFIFFLCSRC